MHPLNALKELQLNPVLVSLTPNAGVLTAMYTAPGAPVDTKINVFRICNQSGGDTTFSVALSTPTQPTPVYIEYAATICAGQSLDLFQTEPWLPPTSIISVMSAGGGVSFVLLGSQVGSDTGAFTGS